MSLMCIIVVCFMDLVDGIVIFLVLMMLKVSETTRMILLFFFSFAQLLVLEVLESSNCYIVL